jgi:hypothetical protein
MMPQEFFKKQVKAVHQSKGNLTKGDWDDFLVPVEITIIGNAMDYISQISRDRKNQIIALDARIAYAEKLDWGSWPNTTRTQRALKNTLQSSPEYAGKYYNQNSKAPYHESNFPNYGGNLKLIKTAKKNNYSFYTIKLISMDRVMTKTANGERKNTYGKMCYAFLFYDKNDEYVFYVFATTN